MSINQQEDGYAQPLLRTTLAQAPAISDTVNGTRNVTVRLRATNLLESSGSQERAVFVVAENLGDSIVTIQLQETATDDPSQPASGRTDVGNAMQLVPLGRSTQQVFLSKEYLEMKTTSGNSKQIRLQLESRLRFSRLGFNIKGFEDDPTYPTSLWRASQPSFDDVNK